MGVEETLELMVFYVISRTEPSKLGVTRLNKILWFADLEHYRKHGRSLTGLSQYTRMPNGPVPEGMDAILSRLKSDGRIVERRKRIFSHEMRELIAMVDPDIESLTAEQVDILNRMIEEVSSRTAGEISEATHDALWAELSNGDPIAIGPASIVKKSLGRKQLDWAMAHSGD